MRGAAPQLSLFPEYDEPGSEPGFDVRESARARRLSIKVFPRGRVEVVVPKRTRPREVESFVNENSEWIKRARESFASHSPYSTAEVGGVSGVMSMDQAIRFSGKRP